MKSSSRRRRGGPTARGSAWAKPGARSFRRYSRPARSRAGGSRAGPAPIPLIATTMGRVADAAGDGAMPGLHDDPGLRDSPGLRDDRQQRERPQPRSQDEARRADFAGPGDRPGRGSAADLMQRLERLPHGHPSSPYHDDGIPRPPLVRLKNLELPLPGEEREPNGGARRGPGGARLDFAAQGGNAWTPAPREREPIIHTPPESATGS